MYPDTRVTEFINKNFVPIRVHAREQADDFKRLGARYGAQWTPTILILDRTGEERHGSRGSSQRTTFFPQLMLGVGHAAFAEGRFSDAESRFAQVVEQFPNADAAPRRGPGRVCRDTRRLATRRIGCDGSRVRGALPRHIVGEESIGLG